MFLLLLSTTTTARPQSQLVGVGCDQIHLNIKMLKEKKKKYHGLLFSSAYLILFFSLFFFFMRQLFILSVVFGESMVVAEY